MKPHWHTWIEHALIAVTIQLIVWALLGDVVAGALVGCAFYAGREHWHQRQLLGGSDWTALDVRRWTRDSQMDLLAPIIATSAVVGAVWGLV